MISRSTWFILPTLFLNEFFNFSFHFLSVSGCRWWRIVTFAFLDVNMQIWRVFNVVIVSANPVGSNTWQWRLWKMAYANRLPVLHMAVIFWWTMSLWWIYWLSRALEQNINSSSPTVLSNATVCSVGVRQLIATMQSKSSMLMHVQSNVSVDTYSASNVVSNGTIQFNVVCWGNG